MNETAPILENLIAECRLNIRRRFRHVTLDDLPYRNLADFQSCDDLPSRLPCIYFLLHPKHGVLYIGKAKNIRQRWRSQGVAGGNREPAHKHHERCVEIGNVKLSWLELDPSAHEMVETEAIHYYNPCWNIRKSKSGYELPADAPSPITRAEQLASRIPCNVMFKLPALDDEYE